MSLLDVKLIPQTNKHFFLNDITVCKSMFETLKEMFPLFSIYSRYDQINHFRFSYNLHIVNNTFISILMIIMIFNYIYILYVLS